MWWLLESTGLSPSSDDVARQVGEPARAALARLVQPAPVPNSARAALGEVLRFVVGTALLFAGWQKALAMFHAVALSKADLPSLLSIPVELVLGAWVLFMGFRPRWLRDVLAIFFAAFACVSAYHVSAHNSSCGCFGAIRVSPAHSLAFDLLAVAALQFMARASYASRRRRYQVIFAAGLLAALAGAGAIGSARRAVPLGASRDVAGLRRAVLLKPEEWVGRPFPLFDRVQGSGPLRAGTWIVVFHRQGCSDCSRALDYHQRYAAEARDQLRFASIEIIERSNISVGRVRHAGIALELGGLEEWVLETPAALLLRDGKVLQCLNRF